MLRVLRCEIFIFDVEELFVDMNINLHFKAPCFYKSIFKIGNANGFGYVESMP